MVIAIGADHGGFHLKNVLREYLKGLGHEVHDLGADSEEPSDYPDFALAVSQEVLLKKAERGILICGSGVGICVAANKFPGIRAATCHDTFSAHQGVEDDNVNVLCLGARVIGTELAKDIVKVWLSARFSEAERHKRRLAKVEKIEKEFLDKMMDMLTSAVCHSGLSGIFPVKNHGNPLLKKDSGRAGMTPRGSVNVLISRYSISRHSYE